MQMNDVESEMVRTSITVGLIVKGAALVIQRTASFDSRDLMLDDTVIVPFKPNRLHLDDWSRKSMNIQPLEEKLLVRAKRVMGEDSSVRTYSR